MKRKYFAGIIVAIAFLGMIFHNYIFFAIQIKLLESADLHLQKSGVPIDVNTLSPSQKIWAHRVNSVERFNYLKDKFAGVEMDLVYQGDKNFLEVNHPPATSKNIDLKEMLEQKNAGQVGLYFDIKNLDSSNAFQILELINRLDSVYRLKSRCIIESRDIASLAPFVQAGYFTSYYLPENVCEKHAELKKAWAVSQDWSVLEPADSCTNGINKLAWELSFTNWLDLSQIRSIVERKDCRILLVNVKSPGYR